MLQGEAWKTSEINGGDGWDPYKLPKISMDFTGVTTLLIGMRTPIYNC